MSPAVSCGPWQKSYFCSACEKELTEGEYSGSSGTCPLCGFVNRSGSSFCKVVCGSKRKVVTVKWSWFMKTFFNCRDEWHWEYRD